MPGIRDKWKQLKDALSGAAATPPKAPPAPPQSTEGIKREIERMQKQKKSAPTPAKKLSGGY